MTKVRVRKVQYRPVLWLRNNSLRRRHVPEREEPTSATTAASTGAASRTSNAASGQTAQSTSPSTSQGIGAKAKAKVPARTDEVELASFESDNNPYADLLRRIPTMLTAIPNLITTPNASDEVESTGSVSSLSTVPVGHSESEVAVPDMPYLRLVTRSFSNTEVERPEQVTVKADSPPYAKALSLEQLVQQTLAEHNLDTPWLWVLMNTEDKVRQQLLQQSSHDFAERLKGQVQTLDQLSLKDMLAATASAFEGGETSLSLLIQALPEDLLSPVGVISSADELQDMLGLQEQKEVIFIKTEPQWYLIRPSSGGWQLLSELPEPTDTTSEPVGQRVMDMAGPVLNLYKLRGEFVPHVRQLIQNKVEQWSPLLEGSALSFLNGVKNQPN